MESKEYLSNQQKNGTVHISEEVIASIAAVAACEVEGVCGMEGSVADRFGRRNPGRGVKLTISGDMVTIDCSVMALYGYSVIQIAKEVQERVAAAVCSMTGCRVEAVNVDIYGITLPK